MLHVLRDRIAGRSPAAIATSVDRLSGIVMACLFCPLMIFFVSCWYAAATAPEHVQEVVDLFPMLDVLWTAGMQFPHFEIIYVYLCICNHNFFTRLTLMTLTMKETWSMTTAAFGQLIAWTMVSTILTNGIPFFETWTE